MSSPSGPEPAETRLGPRGPPIRHAWSDRLQQAQRTVMLERPPIALAAFLASRISGSDPIKTSMTAARLGIVIYFIPIFFLACYKNIRKISFTAIFELTSSRFNPISTIRSI